MANAMKKFKLLHNITSAATATTTSTSHRPPTSPTTFPPSGQYFVPPTASTSKHVRTSSASCAAQSDARKDARQPITHQQLQQQHALEQIALYQQSLHASVHQATFSLPFKHQVVPEVLAPAPQLPTPQSSHTRLPGGFFSLTPEDPHPGVCVQNDFAPQQPKFYGSFKFTTVNPVVLPPIANRPDRPQLTVANISKVDASDSRQYRWNRVLNYVGEVRRYHSTPSEGYVATQRQYVQRTPRDDANSLWDGGSCGTDGVDEFVWDDDIVSGLRFTLPPTCPPELDHHQTMMFRMEDSAIDVEEHRPAKRSKSAERAATASSAMPEYLQPMYHFGNRMPESRVLSGMA